MKIDYRHQLPSDEARTRMRALGDYLHNRHNIAVEWNGDDKASFTGKYLVIKFRGEISIADGLVSFRGDDPGMLWRKRANAYIESKLERYLDPTTAVDDLPRG